MLLNNNIDWFQGSVQWNWEIISNIVINWRNMRLLFNILFLDYTLFLFLLMQNYNWVFTYCDEVSAFYLFFIFFIVFVCSHHFFKLVFGIFICLINLNNLFLKRMKEFLKLRFIDSMMIEQMIMGSKRFVVIKCMSPTNIFFDYLLHWIFLRQLVDIEIWYVIICL